MFYLFIYLFIFICFVFLFFFIIIIFFFFAHVFMIELDRHICDAMGQMASEQKSVMLIIKNINRYLSSSFQPRKADFVINLLVLGTYEARNNPPTALLPL